MLKRNHVRKKREKRPVGIDLFSGVGGLSLGFEQAGLDGGKVGQKCELRARAEPSLSEAVLVALTGWSQELIREKATAAR